MKGNELRRLSRADLLELLIAQTKENENLAAQLEEANEKLKSRQIMLGNVGSIAEAALKLNGIFEDAQSAADQYLKNIDMIKQKEEERARRRCKLMIKKTKAECRFMEEEARKRCESILMNIKEEQQDGESRTDSEEYKTVQSRPKGKTDNENQEE